MQYEIANPADPEQRWAVPFAFELRGDCCTDDLDKTDCCGGYFVATELMTAAQVDEALHLLRRERAAAHFRVLLLEEFERRLQDGQVVGDLLVPVSQEKVPTP